MLLFISHSLITQFNDKNYHLFKRLFIQFLGKYLTYRKALSMVKMDFELYLAVPKKAFDTIFKKDLVKQLVTEYKVHLVVYSDKNQTITSWIKQ